MGYRKCETSRFPNQKNRVFLGGSLMDDNDFGFSFQESSELDVYKHVVYVDKKAHEIYKLLQPFLIKLQNSSGDVIKWPEDLRRKQVGDIIDKIRFIIKEAYQNDEEITKLSPEQIELYKEMGVKYE